MVDHGFMRSWKMCELLRRQLEVAIGVDGEVHSRGWARKALTQEWPVGNLEISSNLGHIHRHVCFSSRLCHTTSKVRLSPSMGTSVA